MTGYHNEPPVIKTLPMVNGVGIERETVDFVGYRDGIVTREDPAREVRYTGRRNKVWAVLGV